MFRGSDIIRMKPDNYDCEWYDNGEYTVIQVSNDGEIITLDKDVTKEGIHWSRDDNGKAMIWYNHIELSKTHFRKKKLDKLNKI